MGRLSAPFHMQAKRPAERPATKGDLVRRVKPQRWQPVKNHRQRDMRHKRARGEGTSAEMRPRAKGDVFFRIAPDIETVRLFEMPRITIRRAKHEEGTATSCDINIPDLGRAGDAAR